ncbi:hypothetical protein CFB3_06590 [Clostridium folliculivorans]|uniref:Uncharacterized protein n=1 Tax=Clostridium folliculivorans TaxID=2886038 RepID=A0A9W6DAM5_9CLOT|nr:hypothetical protein CFOLD11_23560 [Clostridium folliculivorans]GKU28553.1 hypothetical protein CFB3_06590 [Clostridium folliculivorans]
MREFKNNRFYHEVVHPYNHNFIAKFKNIVEINWLNKRCHMSELLELNNFFGWNDAKI